jgi:23S rRNA (cytosine1962-C5)-methyltransferase
VKATAPNIEVLTPSWNQHELLDSGDRRKLERFGPNLIVRHEPKAWWRPSLPESEWRTAAAVHDSDGVWHFSPRATMEWTMGYERLTLQARLTETTKHVGVFPEQMPHWQWIRTIGERYSGRPLRMLNLFGYTGAATLAAAAAGFAVTHVDASKPAVAWARFNQSLSHLDKAPIRWILDDAMKYVGREVRRGQRYDLIALDPPSFGRGPKSELWKVEESLPELLGLCRKLLSENPVGVVMTLYSLEASSIMLGNLLHEMTAGLGGSVQIGELALRQTHGDKFLPLSLFARWENQLPRASA